MAHRLRPLLAGRVPDPVPATVVGRAARLAMLLLSLGLVAARPHAASWYWLGGLAATALVSSLLPERHGIDRAGRIAEAVVVGAATAAVGDPAGPFLPYLLAPSLAGGLLRGVVEPVIVSGFGALALVVGSAVSTAREGQGYAETAAEWVLIALGVGLAGAWIRRLLAPPAAPQTTEASYVAAYRLLSQLRPVARELSVGLDPVTIAQSLLASLRHALGFRQGVILSRTAGSRLTTLAHLGSERPPDWDVEITDEDSVFAEAWFSQRPVVAAKGFDGSGSGLAIPLVIGVRTFGVVALSAEDGADWTQEQVDRAAELVSVSALRLETALLFDEVRGIATAEERRRLAREIHDGIAQELSYLGYVVDGLAAEAKEASAELEASLRSLRAEITRIVSELRHSIFDLRSEVDHRAGLGTALSEYVQAVGRSTGVTVHLSLTESDSRLSADAEAELLRIAQEAVNNSRKHAGAANLWVTLEVDPPRAVLRVEDDGKGIGTKRRADSYGLEIMQERASRLRGQLRVEPREPSGTLVEVRVGT